MKIGDIITKYYNEFHSMVRNADVAVENGNTMEGRGTCVGARR